MQFVDVNTLPGNVLPGRIIYKGVGADGPIATAAMSVGFARYCAEAGPMDPHHHAEESVFIVESVTGRVRFGPTPECAAGTRELTPGMLLHFPENEWHVFEYDEGGHVLIVFIYGQVANIRPEERK